MADIKESKEALIAVLKVAELAKKHFKDGFSLEKAIEFSVEVIKDEDVKAGLSGVSGVGSEVKELSAEEIVELVMVAVMKVPAVLKA